MAGIQFFAVSDTISIHALREEGDSSSCAASTPSTNFYPRPPRGGRHVDPFRRGGCRGISIHALREEGDMLTLFAVADVAVFLSTPSARRATSFMATCTG